MFIERLFCALIRARGIGHACGSISIVCSVNVAFIKSTGSSNVSFNILVVTLLKSIQIHTNAHKRHTPLQQVLTLIHKLLESETDNSELSIVFNRTRVIKPLHTKSFNPRSIMRPTAIKVRVYLKLKKVKHENI